MEEKTINEQMIDLLLEQGPLSTHQITEAMNKRGVRVNGTGQTLGRMRTLERRGRVERIEGDRPGWNRWRAKE
jgi:hypothetical protein